MAIGFVVVEIYLICQVTLQDYVIKRSCDFTEKRSSLHVTPLPSLAALAIVVVETYFVT